MSHAQTGPSTVLDAFWLYASGPNPARPDTPGGVGKWLVYVNREDVDEVWLKIQAALHEGRLGHRAKVATAGGNIGSRRPTKHVVVVYTDDSDDEADVRRVRETLRDLGFVGVLHYKTDDATKAGEYHKRGRRVAKYSA